METRKRAILDALSAFMNQRSGIEYANYGDVKAFRAEQRSITKDLHHARTLLMAVSRSDSITADDLLKASTGAFSGRLEVYLPAPGSAFKANDTTRWKRCEHCGLLEGQHANALCPDGAEVFYTTGQYFPTEYRRAVCAVLASALWGYTREHCMPAPKGYRVESWASLEGRKYGLLRASREEAEADLVGRGGRDWGHVNEVYDTRGNSAGDWLRAYFRKQFGRGIASRWFS